MRKLNELSCTRPFSPFKPSIQMGKKDPTSTLVERRFLFDPRLLGLYGRNLAYISPSVATQMKGALKNVVESAKGEYRGSRCEIVTYRFPTKNIGKFFLSLDVGGQPIRIETMGKIHSSITEITHDQVGGTWFPKKIKATRSITRASGVESYVEEVDIDVIHFNGDVANEVFEFTSMDITPGTTIIGPEAPKLPLGVTPIWDGNKIVPIKR